MKKIYFIANTFRLPSLGKNINENLKTINITKKLFYMFI